jgi:hypothetical protein
LYQALSSAISEPAINGSGETAYQEFSAFVIRLALIKAVARLLYNVPGAFCWDLTDSTAMIASILPQSFFNRPNVRTLNFA